MKNVLLIGIFGVYNYGCEAIVRGTVNILKQINPNINVTYASYNYEDDKRRLADCNITVIKRVLKKRWSFHRILRKFLSYIGYQYDIPFDSTCWVDKYDTVFSIGGDIYTIWPSNGYNKQLPTFLEKCQKKGLKYILWGASVGKFESNPEALSFFKKHLKKVDLIVAREPETVSYLNSIGISDNVIMAPDPAFSVNTMLRPRDNRPLKTIGLNLSPLSAEYKYKNRDEAIECQANAVSRLIDELDVDVVFLPHVVKTNFADDDYLYMNEIFNKLSDVYKKRVSIVSNDPQFIGLKEIIDKCDFVIAARMHCAINAITRGCPTLFLSYSEKAKGMAEFIYGNREAVIDLNCFEDTINLKSLILQWDQNINYDYISSFDFKSLLDYNYN